MTEAMRCAHPLLALLPRASETGIQTRHGPVLLAFSSGDLDDFDAKIYVMRENGTGRTLVPLPVPAVNPDWQPVP